MQLVLGVLFIRLIIEIAGRSKKQKEQTEKPVQVKDVQHPAAFELR